MSVLQFLFYWLLLKRCHVLQSFCSNPHCRRHQSGDDPGGILASQITRLAQTAMGSISCGQSFMDLKCSSQHTSEKIPGTSYKWPIHFLFLVLLALDYVFEACSRLCILFLNENLHLVLASLVAPYSQKAIQLLLRKLCPEIETGHRVLQAPITTLQPQEHLSPQPY